MKKLLIVILFFNLNSAFSYSKNLPKNNVTSNVSLQSELHWSLCESSSKEILHKLDFEITNKEERSTTFYDFKNQNGHYEFNSQGIILRLRSSASDESTSTVKVKVSGVNGFIKEETSSNDEKYKCEEDRYRDKINYFCSLSQGFHPQKEARFSKHQKSFLNKSYGGSLEIEGLTPFGPVSNTVWTFHRSKGFVLEEVALPHSTSFYELSARVSLPEAEERYREYSDFLLGKKLNICPIQESKTLKILNFFQK